MYPTDVRPEILSQILLIQNMLSGLPDAESMLSFSCRGLEDLPGVGEVIYCYDSEKEPLSPPTGETDVRFPVRIGDTTYAAIRCRVTDQHEFNHYQGYVHNICFMIAARLEEQRRQRFAVEYREKLEQDVASRTSELRLAQLQAEAERARAEKYLETAEAIILELDLQGRIERINSGKGLPDSYDPATATTLGMQIIRSVITEQLGGTMELSSNGGYRMTFRFPGGPYGS